MDPQHPQQGAVTVPASQAKRSDSTSNVSDRSQTAADFIATQLSLEAEAKETLPYQFDTCTKPLGRLRQSVYACLTCAPAPASKAQQFTPAGVCYSCSISCHGEHTLVELFTKRDFVCDCGTTRYSNSGTPCSLRLNEASKRKGGVIGEKPHEGNLYNQNFEGRFCGCGEEYDPAKEKGTMFQCLGLGTVVDGGCGEDWWHPECLMGLPRMKQESESKLATLGVLETVNEESPNTVGSTTANESSHEEHKMDDETPLPEGFPGEDDFDHFICYKCVDAFPWIKQYAGTSGFLPAVAARPTGSSDTTMSGKSGSAFVTSASNQNSEDRKRKAEDELEAPQGSKREKLENETRTTAPSAVAMGETKTPKHASLPTPPSSSVSLFLKEDFRDHLCRCSDCFPRLAKHPQLLEEEEPYEPPISESDAAEHEHGSVAGRSVGSGSILERGEAALSSMDRVRAIEGVMAYNHVRDKVKAFLQPFAESGQLVGAEDIKSYFAKLRGDEQAIREAAIGASDGVDHRREQEGGA
nr:protein mlo2 [Quercus suber]